MMKKMVFALVAGLLGVSLAAVARAAPYQQSWQFRGEGASAYAYAWDDCGSTSLDVYVSEQTSHQAGGPPQTTAGIWAGYSAYDWCRGEEAWGWAFIPQDAYDGTLRDAHVAVGFEVSRYAWHVTDEGWWEYELLGTEMLDVDVIWVGEGDVMRGVNSQMFRMGKAMSRTHGNGQWRQADVDLRASLGGVPIELYASYGELSSYHSGGMDMFHY